MSVVETEELRTELRAVARELNAELIEDRGMDVEADVLAIIQMLFEVPEKRTISMKDIAIELQKRYGGEYDRNITSKWVGGIVRRRLQIRTQKSNGVYIIPVTQRPKLERLFEKYGLQGGPAGEGNVGVRRIWLRNPLNLSRRPRGPGLSIAKTPSYWPWTWGHW